MDPSMAHAIAIPMPARPPWATAQESTEDLLRNIWTRDLPTSLAVIDAGADLNLSDREGRTPLHAAIQSGMPDLVGRLIDRWADVNKTNAAGRTPLDLSLYWALRTPIHGTNATAIIRRIVQAGGLSGQEVTALTMQEQGAIEDENTAEKDRTWTNQCKKVAKRVKDWDISPPGTTDEVYVPRQTTPGQSSERAGGHQDDNIAAAVTPTDAAAATALSEATSPHDDDLAHMIEKFTEAWDTDELWSIRIPVA